MLVTRKKNSVRNGRARFPLGSDKKGDVSPKGIFFQREANYEGSLVKSNNVEVLSNHPNPTCSVCDVSNQGVASNVDLGNLEGGFKALSPVQKVEVIRTDGKHHLVPLGTKTRGGRSIGVKGSKSLKRQHPLASQRALSSKNAQNNENRGKLLELKQYNTVWLGSMAPKQPSSGAR